MSRYVIEERAAGWRRWRVRCMFKTRRRFERERRFRTRKTAERHVARLEAKDRHAYNLKTWREVR